MVFSLCVCVCLNIQACSSFCEVSPKMRRVHYVIYNTYYVYAKHRYIVSLYNNMLYLHDKNPPPFVGRNLVYDQYVLVVYAQCALCLCVCCELLGAYIASA